MKLIRIDIDRYIIIYLWFMYFTTDILKTNRDYIFMGTCSYIPIFNPNEQESEKIDGDKSYKLVYRCRRKNSSNSRNGVRNEKAIHPYIIP